MAIQMYLVQPTGERDDATPKFIAEFIAERQGFILMATSHGSLIVAFDEDHLPAVKAHRLVEFVGGVTLTRRPGLKDRVLAADLLGERGPSAREPPGGRGQSVTPALLDGDYAVYPAGPCAAALAGPDGRGR